MSTGIGNHKLIEGEYGRSLAECPYCGARDCEADWVDVGVGEVQCGPFHCEKCGASEISYLDERERSADEKRTGWYAPGSPPSPNANTVGGVLVDHRTAKAAYELGLLDEKPERRSED